MPDVEVIVFPDAEAAFVEWLRSLSAAYPGGFTASTEVRRGLHVRVWRTGGTADLVRDFADMTLDVYADSTVASVAPRRFASASVSWYVEPL